MTWNKDIIPMIEGLFGSRVSAAGQMFAEECRQVVATPGPTPSQPGQAPHRQTGELQAGIFSQYTHDRFQARIGTMVKQGRFTELGTSKMAMRPWLRSTLSRKHAEIVAMIAGKNRQTP